MSPHPLVNETGARILEYLAEHRHPVSLLFLRDRLFPGNLYPPITIIQDLEMHGLVELYENTLVDGHTRMIRLTPQGQEAWQVICRGDCA
jgi:hypothetical protein